MVSICSGILTAWRKKEEEDVIKDIVEDMERIKQRYWNYTIAVGEPGKGEQVGIRWADLHPTGHSAKV